MKIVKPLKLGTLFKPFYADGRDVMSVAIFCLVSFRQPQRLETEPDMWQMLGNELGDGLIVDMVMPKPHGEVLVSASFHSPSGRPVPAGQVTAGFGNWSKTLYVFGDRFWKRNRSGVAVITDPVPAASISLTYSNAFGGADFHKNPLGKGSRPVVSPLGEKTHPLPNVELPSQLVVSKGDTPDPAGFGPLDLIWPQRFSKAGTYDQRWLKEQFPAYAADMDWSIFNMAPQDQQFEQFLNGTEDFFFENMHPDNPRIEGRLPGLRPRCFVQQTIEGELLFKEASARLDTAWFFPHLEKVLLIYRSLVEIGDEDAEDISTLLLACEGEEDPQRDLEHYRQALEKRMDEEKGHLYALNESDLLPGGERSSISEMIDNIPRQENKLNENLDRRAQRERDIAVARLEELGLDSAEIIKDPEPAPDIDQNNLEDLPEVIEKLLRQAEEKQEQMQAEAVRRLDELGMDLETVREEAERSRSRWPKFSADENIAKLKSFGIDDPEVNAQLEVVQAQISDTVRPVAHHTPASYRPTEQEIQQMTDLVLNARITGQSLKDHDLAYIRLAGLDLSGIDLTGAYLEGADLTGARLRGAKLDRAILIRADLSGADCADASLGEINLGGSKLYKTDFTNAVMTSAVMADTDIDQAIFRQADLSGADFSKAVVKRTDFDQSNLRQTTFLESEIRGSRFDGADLSEANLIQMSMADVDFSRANLQETVLVNVEAERVVFDGADMTGFRLVGTCSCVGGSFQRAKLTGANFRGADLSGASFKWADISDSDFSQCKLTNTVFSLCTAHQTQFVKADLSGAEMVGINLMEGNLQKAILHDTQLRASNLYAVDFMKANFHNTDLRLSNLKKVFLEPWINK